MATIDNFTDVAHGEEAQLQAALMKNPVSIAIEADKPYFQHYKSGTLDNATGTHHLADSLRASTSTLITLDTHTRFNSPRAPSVGCCSVLIAVCRHALLQRAASSWTTACSSWA